ncbi:MAG TPA: T9SS type B sorting domain-containing protein, partial [Chitinophagaceae bacterium]|nr:T9SS type B sorting domain-containing protein [Chitinophagaceae bacterium]
ATFTQVNVLCFGGSNGSIDLSVTGGTAPYTYLWSNTATTQDLTGLIAGTYSVTVTDAVGCTTSVTVTITQPALLVASETHSNVICHGGSTGSIDLTPSGGVGPYTYLWSNAATTQDLTGLIAGTYSVTVTDANGCTATVSVTITEPALINLTITDPAPVCLPATVDITAPSVTVGSDPGLTYTYWQDAAATLSLGGPNSIGASGTYYIMGTNAAGCSVIKPVVVMVNPKPTAILSGTGIICIGSPKTLTITFTGTGPFNVTYTDGTNIFSLTNISANPYQFDVSPTVNTTYTLTSVNDKFCSNSSAGSPISVTVIIPPAPIRLPTVSVQANTNQLLSARVPTAGYTYLWTPPSGLSSTTIFNPTFNFNQTVNYLITMSSPNGCITVDTMRVAVATPAALEPDIHVPQAFTPNNDGHNDKLMPFTVNIRELKFFKVFNRWGQLVFQTNTIGTGWDGMFNGKPAVVDTYTWMAEGVGFSGQTIRRTGNTALIR